MKVKSKNPPATTQGLPTKHPPVTTPATAPASAPTTVPAPVPGTVPAPVPVPATYSVPVLATIPVPVPATVPALVPATDPAPVPAIDPAPVPARSSSCSCHPEETSPALQTTLVDPSQQPKFKLPATGEAPLYAAVAAIAASNTSLKVTAKPNLPGDIITPMDQASVNLLQGGSLPDLPGSCKETEKGSSLQVLSKDATQIPDQLQKHRHS
ncbi:uncharacterized protein [Palaemon carinicauda]|uniref:uncharacterized protein n=1 Tax=Palaemon carinicauda TaxID=392227 RepID=UPI0035B69E23